MTFGTPQVCSLSSFDGISDREILEAASIAEAKSEHPLAKTVIAQATTLGIPAVEPDEFSYTPGKGVRVGYQREEILAGTRNLLLEHGLKKVLPLTGAQDGTSAIYVSRAGQVLGVIRVADVFRPQSKAAVTAMRHMGLKIVLLSGDSQAAIVSVGRDLGVDDAVGTFYQSRRRIG